jgi:hypothetical protein
LKTDDSNTKLHTGYTKIYESATGGSIYLHERHGKDELKENLEACKLLADKGHKIQLLPLLEAKEKDLRAVLLWDVHGEKNPDIRINFSVIADIKTPSKSSVSKTTLNDCIYRAGQQKVPIVVINLHKANYSFGNIKEALLSALQPERNKSIREIWIITSDNNLLILPRKMVNTRRFYAVLNIL